MINKLLFEYKDHKDRRITTETKYPRNQEEAKKMIFTADMYPSKSLRGIGIYFADGSYEWRGE